MCSPSPELTEEMCGSFINPNYVTNYTCLGWSRRKKHTMSIFSGNADLFHNDQKEMEKRVCVYHAVVKDYHDDNADKGRAGARRASQFSVRSRQPCLLWRDLCNSLYPGLALFVLFESLIMTISTRCGLRTVFPTFLELPSSSCLSSMPSSAASLGHSSS